MRRFTIHPTALSSLPSAGYGTGRDNTGRDGAPTEAAKATGAAKAARPANGAHGSASRRVPVFARELLTQCRPTGKQTGRI